MASKDVLKTVPGSASLDPHRRWLTSAADRFEHYSMPIPFSGCWVWVGCCDRYGYGLTAPTFGSRLAHRAAYRMHRGEIPQGQLVLHHCDIPCCVNPDHLYLGTHSENMQDMHRRGRYVRRSRDLTKANLAKRAKANGSN